MKKIFFLFLICLFALQSCSINSEIIYHKDSASTTVMDFDMKDAMQMVMAMASDSLNNDTKGLDKLDKLPKTWTSLYEMEKKEGKLKTENPDSIKIMKKIFMKSNVENNELTGISIKMDHFSKADYSTISNFSKDDKLPVNQLALNSWDGNILIIETDNFFNLKTFFKDISEDKGIPGTSTDSLSEDDSDEKSMEMIKMMYKKIGTTLKFENKIKSITGKHDWLKKVDDYSVRIDQDLDFMFGKNKKSLKDSDKKIIIVTE